MVPIRRCRSLRTAQVLTACAIVVDPDPQACRNGTVAAASVSGLCSPLPHLPRDWAYPTPHSHRDWARPCRIRTGARLPATSAPGLGSPLPHLHWDWAHPCPHLCRDCSPSTRSTRFRSPGRASSSRSTPRSSATPTRSLCACRVRTPLPRGARLCTSRATLRVLPRQGRPCRFAGNAAGCIGARFGWRTGSVCS